MLASTVKENLFEWESHRRKVCLAYTTSVHVTTGHTPFFLMFGRQAQLPVDLVFKTDKAPSVSSSEYALELQQTLERAYDKVRQTTSAKQQLQKRLYDQQVHGELYQVGDHVWLHTTVLAHTNTKKLYHPWTGPYCVVKCLTDSTYRIHLLSNPCKCLVVHFDRLKPCSTGAQNAAAEDAPESTNHPPVDSSSGQNIPRSLPIGAGLKVVEPADVPHAGQQYQPPHQLLLNPATSQGLDFLPIATETWSQFEIIEESGTYSSERGAV